MLPLWRGLCGEGPKLVNHETDLGRRTPSPAPVKPQMTLQSPADTMTTVSFETLSQSSQSNQCSDTDPQKLKYKYLLL